MARKRRNDGKFAKGNSGGPGRPRADAHANTLIDRATLDSWVNTMTGMGTSARDYRYHSAFGTNGVYEVSDAEARSLWIGNDLAARAIEIWPEHMTRAGWYIDVQDTDDSADIEAERQRASDVEAIAEELNVDDYMRQALEYENAYGGPVGILLGANDGQGSLSTPLNIERVQRFDHLTLFEPSELIPVGYYSNPRAPKFGEPGLFQINPVIPGTGLNGSVVADPTKEVHESRLLLFNGIRASRQVLTMQGRVGHSLLTRIYSVLRDFDMSWAAAATLLKDFAQAVFKMQGLAELMASTDGKDTVLARMEVLALARSVFGGIMVDVEEDFERKQTPMTGFDALLDKFIVRVTGALRVPLTVLWGMSPGGLNATGESDLQIFDQNVAAEQEKKLKPRIKRLCQILFAANGGEPRKWDIKFNPLRQQSGEQQATMHKTQADADAIYLDRGVVSPEELAVSRFGNGYSLETKVEWGDGERDTTLIGSKEKIVALPSDLVEEAKAKAEQEAQAKAEALKNGPMGGNQKPGQPKPPQDG